MTRNIFDLIDAEDHHKAMIIGHDWGSITAGAVYHYYPERVVGLVNVSVAYLGPSRKPFDLDQMRNMTQGVSVYRLCEHWNYLTAGDSSALMVTLLHLIWANRSIVNLLPINLLAGEIDDKEFAAICCSMAKENIEASNRTLLSG